MTKEDHDTPSNAELVAEDPDDPYEEQGQSFHWEINLTDRNMFCLRNYFLNVCLFRADPAKWRHQLELSVLGWHGQWSVWLPIQRGFFMLPL